MLECQVHGAEDLRVVDVPTPQPGPGEVLVRLGAAGINAFLVGEAFMRAADPGQALAALFG